MNHHSFSKAMLKARKAAWLIVSWCVLGVSAVAIVRSNLKEFSPPREVSSTPTQSDVAGRAMETHQVAGTLLVSLFPTGFEPSEVTYPAGKFLLGVNNRTGLSDLQFQLTDEKHRPVGEKRMVKEKTWRKVIELKPGRYVLRVVDHPSWLCELTITP